MIHTLFSLVAEGRTQFGERDFLLTKQSEGWAAKTYNRTFDEARLLASWLLSVGIHKSDTLSICAEGSTNWVIAEYGLLMAGAIAVPLSFKLLSEEISYRLEHSEAKAVFTNANHFAKIAKVAAELNKRFAKRILLISLDDDFDPRKSGIDYPADLCMSFADCLRAGESLLSANAAALEAIQANTREEDIVTISYTSGTTGNPKGIMLSHGNYWINSLDAVNTFRIQPGDSISYVVLPVDHSFAQTVGIHAAVQRGIQVWFVDSKGGGMAILRNIPVNLRECEPKFMITVPALSGNIMKKIFAEIEKRGGIVAMLFNLGIDAGMRYWGDQTRPPASLVSFINGLVYFPIKALVLNKVKTQVFGKRAQYMVGGGASFDITQQRFFRALGVPLYQGYGMTEASPVISSNTQWNLRMGTSGKAMPHVQIRIMKDDGTLAAPNEKGEIQASGPNIMQGYFKNETATQETVVDGWLRTGDLGWLDPDGYLTVAGRAKALLISADGEKYSPEGIEDAILSASKAVNQVLVWNDHRRFTCALVTLDDSAINRMIKEQGLSNPAQLLDALKESFYSFKNDTIYRNTVPLNWTPATFQIIEEAFSEANGLVNSTMKIVRYKVVEAYASLIEYIYTDEGSNFRNQRNIQALKKYF